MKAPTRSRDLLDLVLDPGSFRSWDDAADETPRTESSYGSSLRRARERSGSDEAVRTGQGTVEGQRVALLCSEFGFLGGSIGVFAARRLVNALRRATAERMPVLALPASGGTRMQEGTPAFLTMPAIAAAVTAHKAAGLPYLVYLRHPTTGGVLASWGSLGHLTFAEPGALVGFLGPKVYEALRGRPFLDGIQTAENLHRSGIVDAVVPPARLAELLGSTLRLLTDRPPRRPRSAAPPSLDTGRSDAWQDVLATRRRTRPGAREVIHCASSEIVSLAGTSRGETADGLMIALVRFGSVPCVVVAQDRAAQSTQPIGPGSLRAARRGFRLAAGLGLPVASIIDTPGGELSPAAEEGALAGEIADTLAELAGLTVPTVSVLLGQGTGGAALALFPADRTLAARRSWLSALPPEGAAAIVHRDPARAPEVVAEQHIRAADLLRIGAVDTLIDERPDAADEPDAFCSRAVEAIEAELLAVLADPSQALRHQRFQRILRMQPTALAV